MPKWKSTNIVYSGIEDKGLTVVIKDENGKNWTLWKKEYESEEPNPSYTDLTEHYKIGDTIGIKYGEKEESFTGKEGNTVNFTRKTIYEVLPPLSNPDTQNDNKPRTSDSMASDSLFWQKKTFAQCLWGYWIHIKKGEPLTLEDKKLVWANLVDMNKYADSQLTKPESMNQAELKINKTEDIDVDDVPF